MRFLWLFALAGAPLLASAQGLEVSGRVVDAATGAPIPRAAVTLDTLADSGAAAAADAGAEQTTGADGSFRFAGLPAGRYRLSGSRRGYITAAYQEHEGFFAAMIVGTNVPGTTGVRLQLQPFCSITGEVRDSSGDPVETASLTLFAPADDGSGKVVARQTRFLANGSPRFEFENLQPGTYYLAVTARPWFAESGQSDAPNPLDVAYPVTFFDGADSSAGAQPIVLRAGETAQASIALHAVPAVHVEVPAQGGGGFQFPSLGQAAFGETLPVNVGMWGSGRFSGPIAGRAPMTLSIAPGSYTLERAEKTTSLEVRGDVTLEGEDAQPAPVALSGKLAMAEGGPLPGPLTLRLVPGSASGRFAGRGRRWARGFAGFGQRPIDLPVAGDGSFHTNRALPGVYRLSVSGSGESAWAVTAAAASGGTVDSNLLLSIDADPVMLAATVSPANAILSGRIAGGASGAMVLVVPESGPAAVLGKEDESDSDGTWTVRGVAPGRYRVLAIRDGWDLAWQQPGVLTRYLQSAVVVTAPAFGSLIVQTPIPLDAR